MTLAVIPGLLSREAFQAFSFVFGDNTGIHIARASEVRHEPGNRIGARNGDGGHETGTQLVPGVLGKWDAQEPWSPAILSASLFPSPRGTFCQVKIYLDDNGKVTETDHDL
jgi:hypothetical protein